jgi:phage gp45-like
MQYYGNDILEVTKNEASKQAVKYLSSSTGTITSIDKNKYMAKVMLEPLGYETGWLPISSIYTGNEFGWFALPAIGTEVTVEFEMGNPNCGKVMLSNFNNTDCPIPMEPGEVKLLHESGSFLIFHNDGSIEISANTVLKLAGGGEGIARIGDSVQVNVPEYGNCTGTITSGSSKVQSG